MKGTQPHKLLLPLLLLSSITYLGVRSSEEHQTGTSKFLTISDIHLNEVASDAATFGCDTTEPLFQYAMNKFDSLISEEKPEFIVYLGDLPVHEQQWGRNCQGTSKGIPGDVGSVLEGLRKQAEKHNVPLMYLPGNNDGFGGDYSSFTDSESGTKITPFTQDKGAKGKWPVINGNKASNSDLIINQNAELGFYSAYPLGKKRSGKNLRALMLNTVIFCCPSGHTPYQSDDNITQSVAANTQLNWIKQQLADAKTAGDAVIIAMHIPPGLDAFSGGSNWIQSDLYYDSTQQKKTPILNAMIEMVQMHTDNIVGLLTSHTHMDELKAFFNGKDELIELAISTPGVTVQHGNNPGMKVFTYDKGNYEWQDFTTYYANPYLDSKGEYTWDHWGQNKYTYSEMMGCQAGENMLQCMKRLAGGKGTIDQSQITVALDSFYVVKSPKGGYIRSTNALNVTAVK